MKHLFGLIVATSLVVAAAATAGEVTDPKSVPTKPAVSQSKPAGQPKDTKAAPAKPVTSQSKGSAKPASSAAAQPGKTADGAKGSVSAEEVACKDYAVRAAGKDGKLKFIGNAKEVVEKGLKTITVEYAAVDYTKAERNYSLVCSFDSKNVMNRVSTTQLSK